MRSSRDAGYSNSLVPVGRLIIGLTFLVMLGGCATTPVQPWERGRLARWDMRWDPDSLQAAMDGHTHFSREGSDGHIGAAGGGCGCN